MITPQRLGFALVTILAMGTAHAQQASPSSPATASPPAFDSSLLESKPTATKPAKSAVAKVPAAPAPPPAQTVTTTTTTSSTKSISVNVEDSTGSAPIAALPSELATGVAATNVVFDIVVGETLKSALARWAKSVGWTLIWEAQVDYAIEAPMSFKPGTSFLEAVRQIMGSFWDRTQWLTATAYKNNVLVISGRDAR